MENKEVTINTPVGTVVSWQENGIVVTATLIEWDNYTGIFKLEDGSTRAYSFG